MVYSDMLILVVLFGPYGLSVRYIDFNINEFCYAWIYLEFISDISFRIG
jgi:hypothetical protein